MASAMKKPRQATNLRGVTIKVQLIVSPAYRLALTFHMAVERHSAFQPS